MSDTIIRVENLGKKYIIDHQQEKRSYKALRDVIADQVRSLGQMFGRNGKGEDPAHEEFWALKDVSFEIKQGDRVGIIGRNGAGKSTLLKILSRITEPTTGKINIKGRVASLLEVGTGFHPELTGRENIYLNGAILGMSKVEIKRKFDEIVDFAEVEKFLDTPVKRYSSGMYVRLAFAVAAHLEPEILIVDEVLAVGDASFQKKCLGKMEDVAENEGRTVLFVSHNMAAIKKFCNIGIFLKQGRIKMRDEMSKVASYYDRDIFALSSHQSEIFPLVNNQYQLSVENITTWLDSDQYHATLNISVTMKSRTRIQDVGLGISIQTSEGVYVAKLGPILTGNFVKEIDGCSVIHLTARNIEQYLSGGGYYLGIYVVIKPFIMIIDAEKVAEFEVPIFDVFGSGTPCELNKHGIVPLPIFLSKS